MRGTPLAIAFLLGSLLAGCTGSDDGDGLDEKVEKRGWSVLVIYPDGAQDAYTATSDPGREDTDDDGLNDFQEFLVGADPTLVDTDRDRLADGPMLCPAAGSQLAAAVAAAQLLPHPDRGDCYLGEARWELLGVRIETKPTSAHTDTGPGLDDGLSDSEEIVGWDVNLHGSAHHVFSNPSFTSVDTDSDGLHDGNERLHGLDPRTMDTDGDGESDLEDAAPLGNLVLSLDIESANVKVDRQLGGGVRFKVVLMSGDETPASGTRALARGRQSTDLALRMDISDQATTFTEHGGAGQWTSEVVLEFYHDGSAGDDPLRVSTREPGHRLILRYDAFADTWTGGAPGGTTSGPDADVTFDLDALIE